MEGNGKEAEGFLLLDLTDGERKTITSAHQHHLKCELKDCVIHNLVHMIVKVEAQRRKCAHDINRLIENGTHGVSGVCEKCQWSPLDWIRSLAEGWDG